MKPPTLPALDVTPTALRLWPDTELGKVAISAGLVGVLQREEAELTPDAVALALSDFPHPRGWAPTNLPDVLLLSTPSGRPFAAWFTPEATIIGFHAEIALAIALDSGASLVTRAATHRVQ